MNTPVIPAASYPILSTDTLAIMYAKAMIRPYVRGPFAANPNNWVDPGEFMMFQTATTAAEKEFWSKSLPDSVLLLTANVKTQMAINFKCAQFTTLMRAYSLLGTVVPVNQAAIGSAQNPVDYLSGPVSPGDTIYLNAYNATVTGVFESVPGVNGAAPTKGAALPASEWEQTDFAFGAVQIDPNLTDSATLGNPVIVEYYAPARTFNQIQAGNKSTIDIELFLRGVNSVGQKGILHMKRLRLLPKGNVDYISGSDDFASMEFSAKALTTTDDGVASFGTWTPLDA